MGNLISKAPVGTAAPTRQQSSSDTIAPFRYFDNQTFFRQFVLVFTYRFDDVLDHEKLHASLKRLTEIGNWREIGARVRKNQDGNLDYHLPQSFDQERPTFTWSHVEHDQSIAEHALGARFPRATPRDSGPQFFEDASTLLPLVESGDAPRKIDDWTSTDAPLLAFHIVSFNDATLITVNWCHAFMDGVGIASLLKTWTAVLAGKEDDVPPLMSFKQDPVELLSARSQAVPESYVLHKWMLAGTSFFKFVAGQMWEMIWYGTVETRMLCLPGPLVVKLKTQAIEHLKSARSDDNIERKEFVSEGDVISAWLARLTVSALRLPSSQPVALANVLDTRGLFGSDILPEKTAYAGNMCVQFFAYVAAGELAKETLGATALRIRKALEEQRTVEQFEAYVATHKEMTAAGQLPLFGPWNMVMMNLSNWHKARFFEYDFSPAIIPHPVDDEKQTKATSSNGKPTYISITGHENVPLSSRNVGCLIGKDEEGYWWMNWTLRKGAWPAFIEMAKSSAGQN